MKMIMRHVAAIAVLAIVSVPVVSRAADTNYEGFKIYADNNGTIQSMICTDPPSYLGIEKEYAFTIGADGSAASCNIKFKNGVERAMKPGETALHFAQCGGPKAIWDWAKEHGKSISYVLATDKIPDDAYNKIARLLLSDGKMYIGHLGKSDKPDMLSLTIEGASGGPLLFGFNVIKEIQMMK